MDSCTVVSICGSLRKQSFNARLLAAAVEHAPDGMNIIEYRGLAMLPPYNGDQDTADAPGAVNELRQILREADGLLIASPEYNYSVPGVLKNAIDWASRPAADSALLHKPVAIMGASPSQFGTVRAQLSLRQSFLWTRSEVVTHPEVMLVNAHEHFEEQTLTNDMTHQLLGDLLKALQLNIESQRILNSVMTGVTA